MSRSLPAQSGASTLGSSLLGSLLGLQDRSVRLWNPHRGIPIKVYTGHGYDVRDVAIASDNSKQAPRGGPMRCGLMGSQRRCTKCGAAAVSECYVPHACFTRDYWQAGELLYCRHVLWAGDCPPGAHGAPAW